MKHIGNIIAGTGLTGAVLGICGYDSQPLICGVAAVIGLLLLYIGYQISRGYADQEDVLEGSRHEK